MYVYREGSHNTKDIMQIRGYFCTFPAYNPERRSGADSMFPGISVGYNEYGHARVCTDVE